MADQRTGTARVLVLIASAAVFAAGGVVCFLVLLLGPAVKDGNPVAGAIAYTALSLVAAGAAVTIAVRAATAKKVVLGGCGTLLVGTLVAAGAMVLLMTG
ncbi:hypothetical protein [Actinokineospora globicatena]|uniref:Uncharacterized protein n=1 Tax=Actinokineospora globicatena TaxID=103729 RepID=A0A9W6QQN6_9PSEU|nr:hypothetical protein [Actinokineospora globicatena]GLW93025.1 hypothetical protein Aglo03_38410 [Actinokineospora globicatena]